MLSSLVTSPFALLLMAPQIARPAETPFFPEETARVIPWPASIPALAKGRMVVGDVTGDLHPDAVVLNGGTPVVVYGPAVHSAVFEVDLFANDLSLLEPAGAGQACDLVLVGPAGLLRLSGYDAGEFEVEVLGGPAWIGARRVLAADTNADGVEDLIGLSASDEILFLEDVRGPAPVETILPIEETVLDLAAVDWEGDGVSERRIAVLTPSGLVVRTKSGVTSFTLGRAIDGGALTVLRQSDVPFERLAIVCGEQTSQVIRVVDRTGEEEDPLDLGAAGAFALAVGDANLDGSDDLYVLHHVSHETVLLFNRAALPNFVGTFHFGPRSRELVEVADDVAPPASWSAWPTLSDLSSDGDPDLLVFVESSNQLVYLENTRRKLARRQVEVEGGAYVFDEALQHGELRLNVTVPEPLGFQPTHVEIVGWKQVDAAFGGVEVEPVAVAHAFGPLNGDLEAQTHVLLHELDLFTPSIYHFDLRAVRVAGPMVVAAGPSAVHAFTTPDFLVAGLEAQFGEGTPLRVFVVEDGEEIELDEDELAERLLAPKEIKTDKVPLIAFPPNPFG